MFYFCSCPWKSCPSDTPHNPAYANLPGSLSCRPNTLSTGDCFLFCPPGSVTKKKKYKKCQW